MAPIPTEQPYSSWPESLSAMAACSLHMAGELISHGSIPGTDNNQQMMMGDNTSSLGMNETTAKIEVERMPQWGYREVKDFIDIRSELKRDFTRTKRNKLLWETVASRMKELGYRRSADQCKLKWKNLFNRYKCVALSAGMDSCPFYEELHAIFSDPHTYPDGLFMMDSGSKRGRSSPLIAESEDLSIEEDENEAEDSENDDRMMKRPHKRAHTAESKDRAGRINSTYNSRCKPGNMQEVLEDFLHHQQRMEVKWMEALRRREEERRRREMEWRDAMEKLERERMVREQVWREREEQRRAREEVRAQKRDELFSLLLSMLAKRG